jgi:pimeloyl-ACP methyl ester carboxylesterase
MELQRKDRQSFPWRPTPVLAGRNTIRLRNGSHVALAEYGDPKGVPLIFCHGWPSSRTMAELAHQAALDAGIRVVSPDRPGIRDSSFQPNRKLLDWPPVLEEVIDQLGLERFHILAISGGAPYAFATAWMMPHRVRAIAVVSGAPPIAELADQSGLWKLYRWMLYCYRRHPRFSRSAFWFARPFLSLRPPRHSQRMLLKLLQPCDAEVLRDAWAFNACFESQRQAWRASAMGVLADAEIYAQPWGFPLEGIEVPVRLWHGKKDRSFSFRLAEEIAARLPNCTTRLVEDAGHYSLPIRRMPEILADLIGAGRTANFFHALGTARAKS